MIFTVSYTSQVFSEGELTKEFKEGELEPCAYVDSALSLACLGQLRYQATYMASQRRLLLQQSFVGESRI